MAASQLYAPMGYLNLDLMLCGALALFLPAPWTPVLMFLSMAVDLVEGLARTWFFRPSDLVDAARSVVSLPAARIAVYGASALTVYGGFACTSYMLRRRTARCLRVWTAAALLLVTGLSVTIDVIWGERRGSGFRDSMGRFSITGVPELNLFRQWEMVNRLGHAGPRDVRQTDSASAHALELLPGIATGQKPNIVEIVVESWGQDRAGTIDGRLLANYRVPQIDRRYRIVTGTAPFWGSTVPGEIRELCSSTLGLGVLHITSGTDLSGCLPAKLRRMGYRTEAVHGYFGGMFDRYRWYPLLGFESNWFEDRLRSEGLRSCAGAFPGICDGQVAPWIGARLARSSGPLFLYWMTLNSHLPVPAKLSELNPVSCDFDSQVGATEAFCAWFKLEYQVHQSIADLASRADIPPTAFIVVGDHAPPFVDPAIRNRFAGDRVPFVLLIPRGGGQNPERVAGITAPASGFDDAPGHP
jgi:hypothetical protein